MYLVHSEKYYATPLEEHSCDADFLKKRNILVLTKEQEESEINYDLLCAIHLADSYIEDKLPKFVKENIYFFRSEAIDIESEEIEDFEIALGLMLNLYPDFDFSALAEELIKTFRFIKKEHTIKEIEEKITNLTGSELKKIKSRYNVFKINNIDKMF